MVDAKEARNAELDRKLKLIEREIRALERELKQPRLSLNQVQAKKRLLEKVTKIARDLRDRLGLTFKIPF